MIMMMKMMEKKMMMMKNMNNMKATITTPQVATEMLV